MNYVSFTGNPQGQGQMALAQALMDFGQGDGVDTSGMQSPQQGGMQGQLSPLQGLGGIASSLAGMNMANGAADSAGQAAPYKGLSNLSWGNGLSNILGGLFSLGPSTIG